MLLWSGLQLQRRRRRLEIRVDADFDDIMRPQAGRLVRLDIAIGAIFVAAHDPVVLLRSAKTRHVRIHLGELRAVASLFAQKLGHLDVDRRPADCEIDLVEQLLVFAVLPVDDIDLRAIGFAEPLASRGQGDLEIDQGALCIRNAAVDRDLPELLTRPLLTRLLTLSSSFCARSICRFCELILASSDWTC